MSLLLSCAGGGTAGTGREQEDGAPAEVAEAAEVVEAAPGRRITVPAGALLPESLRPGEPFAVAVVLPEDREGLSVRLLSANGRPLGRAPFFTLERDEDSGAVLKVALLAVSTLAAPGTGQVLIDGLPAELPAQLPAEREAANAAPGLPALFPQVTRFPARYKTPADQAVVTAQLPVAGQTPALPETTDPAPIATTAPPDTATPVPTAIPARYQGTAILAAGLPLTILPRTFQAEQIDLDTRNTGIRTDSSPRRYAEVDELQRILDHTGTDIYAEAAFVPPLTSTRRTSEFGDRRVYRYVSGATDTSVHAGIDYGVPRGTAVSAAAPGKVVFAGERIVTGNSVIIEHLPGVYSLYYHLDSIAIAAGDPVSAGDPLGESGMTGLATGPHLHWEIRVAGENADPDALTARPLLDRAAIRGLLSW